MVNIDRLIVPSVDELLDLPIEEVLDLFHRELLRAPHTDTLDQWLTLGAAILDRTTFPFLACQVGRYMAVAHANNSNFEEATAWLAKSEEIAIRNGLSRLVAECKNTRGIIAGQRGRYTEAVVHFENGLDLVDERSQPAICASLMTNLGLALDHLGQSVRALESHQRSIAIRECSGSDRGLASSYFNVAELHARRGEYDVAYEYYLRAKDLQEQSDDVNSVARTYSSIAYVLAKSGDASEALRYQNDAETLAHNVADMRLQGTLMSMRSSILQLLGRHDEAQAIKERCLQFAQLHGLREMQVYLEENIAKEHASAGRWEEAARVLTHALSVTRDMGLRWLEALISKDLATALRHTGRLEEAPQYLQEALQIFRDNQAVDEYLATLIDLTGVYRDLRRTPEAFDTLATWAADFRAEASRQLVDRINDIRLLHRHERTIRDAELMALRNQELTNAMQRQRELVRRLEEVNAEKDEFMMIAAHDLRNPLGLVKSMLQTIVKHADTLSHEDIIDLCNDMHMSIDRMQSLVTTFLDVSRTADDPSRLRLADINVCAVVQRTTARYRSQAERKLIKLSTSDYEEVYAHADPAALEEIVDNLVSNAVKFCSAGCRVDVAVVTAENKVCMKVSDNGPGLSPADVDRLFTKYGMLTPRPTDGEPSSGLGLYLCSRLAERMGGSISCTSSLGSGCTFTVCLPNGHHH